MSQESKHAMNLEDTSSVAFMGEITAGYTHEIRNILSIIAESVGLMQDILSMDRERMLQYLEKLQSSLGKVDKQLERGEALSTHLNRLAHAPDREHGQVDLDEAAQTMVALSQRFAKRRQLQLNHLPAEGKVHIETKPVVVMMLIYSLIQAALQGAPQGTSLDVQTGLLDHRARLVILCANHIAPADFHAAIPAEAWEALEALCRSVQAEAKQLAEGPGIEVLFP